MNIINKKGFTLFEIIIALALTAVITAGGIYLLNYYIQIAKARKTVDELVYLGKAENLYYQKNTCIIQETVYNPVTEENGVNCYNNIYHIYADNFYSLQSDGDLTEINSNNNPFGKPFTFTPSYGQVAMNNNQYCVRSAGILITTEVPEAYKGAASLVPGASVVNVSGGWATVGFFQARKTGNVEMKYTLKYNW